MRNSHVIAAAAAVGVLVVAAAVSIRPRLPDSPGLHPDGGFKAGECTWYVFQRTQDFGWQLRFDKPYGRHAAKWWKKVGNAERGLAPVSHAVMVFEAWPGNPYGHVAFVERVLPDGSWEVTHANLGVSERDGERAGIPVYRARFEPCSEGARLFGTRHVFRLLGFLKQPAA